MDNYIKKTKICVDFSQICVPPGVPKICFFGVFLWNSPEHTKSTEIGECTGFPGNHSISKLKLCRSLTSAQAKIGFPSSLDNSLESKWKILLKLD